MSVGPSLAAAREEAGLSVAEVSARTRIRASVVERIEHDDFAACGGDFYARAQVQMLARAVGIDPEPLLAEFDAEHAVHEPAATEVFEADTLTRARRHGPNWSAVMTAALVAAIAVVVVQVVRGDDTPREPTNLAGPTTVASPSPEPEETTAPEPTASPTDTTTPIAQAPRKEVTLRITAVAGAKSWVEVTDSSGATLFTGILSSGQDKSFRDRRSLRIVAGNAAGIELVVNGTDLGTPGGPGEVATLTFRPGDPEGSVG